jgi:glucan phosphoethanolaminetransferase (alkaline phosphatase superfamily)
MKNPIFRIFGLQFGIFVLYQVLAHYMVREQHEQKFININARLLTFHWLLLAILTVVYFVKKKKEQGAGYLLSLAVILVVGFGSCASLVFTNWGPSPEELFRQDSIWMHDSLQADSIRKNDSIRLHDSPGTPH